MNIFTSDQTSHDHSLRTLNLLANYNDFMDSIEAVCDMGCGVGNDLAWWATRTYLDSADVERPYNYNCVGIDMDTSRQPHQLDNMKIIKGDFESIKLDKAPDVLWSHDSFRYAVNPLATLSHWHQQMNNNGMLVLIVPQTINIAYNKLTVRTLPNNFYHYTITNLIYMLAVSGFDCNAGHFVKYPNDPWVHCVVYRNDDGPLDPKTTNWYTLAEKKLIPDSAIACVDRYGYVKQEELQTHWLDRQFCNWNQL